MINIDSEETSVNEINCTITSTTGNNYTINCQPKEDKKYAFQSASSFIDNDILLVNFNIDNINGSIPEIQDSDQVEEIQNYHRLFNLRKSSGLNTGSIVGITLASIVALVAVIGTICFFKRKYSKEKHSNESSVMEINNLNIV